MLVRIEANECSFDSSASSMLVISLLVWYDRPIPSSLLPLSKVLLGVPVSDFLGPVPGGVRVNFDFYAKGFSVGDSPGPFILSSSLLPPLWLPPESCPIPGVVGFVVVIVIGFLIPRVNSIEWSLTSASPSERESNTGLPSPGARATRDTTLVPRRSLP